MLPLGLKASDLRKLHATLADSHSVKVNVAIQNLAGDNLTHLDPDTLDGQVNMDASGAVTRSATLSILDPEKSLNFDADSPGNGAMYVDRLIRVTYSVNVPALSEWVNIPVFTGPITKLDRSDDVINVECQGMESLALFGVWRPIAFKKGHGKVDAIRTILRDRCGETRFDLPDLAARLPKPLSLKRESIAWDVCQRIAASMNRQLYYDGRGVCRLRTLPGNVFTFKTGNGGTITSPPLISYQTDTLRNAVHVHAGKPRGLKKKTDTDPSTALPHDLPDIRAEVVAPRSHPLSPQKLGRNGVASFRPEFVTNSKVRSKREAKALARRILDDHLRESIDVTFDALPVPHLEELDMVRVVTDEGAFTMRLKSFSLPLTVGSSMTIGHMRKVSVNPRRIRR